MQDGRLIASVVMPFYNAAAHLPHTLPAILAERAPFAFEVLLVDNGSTDGSQELAENCIRGSGAHARVVTASQPGSYAARQRGLEEARGEIVIFIDADCVAQRGLVVALVDALRETRVLVAGARVVEARGQSGWVERYSARAGLLSQSLTLGQGPRAFVQTACLALRRHDALAVGGFDVSLYSGGDADFCWRLKACFPGRDLAEVSAACVEHRHRTSLGELYAQFFRYGTGDIALARKHGWRPSLFAMKLVADAMRIVFCLPCMLLLGLPALFRRDLVLFLAPFARVVRVLARRRGQLVAMRGQKLPRA